LNFINESLRKRQDKSVEVMYDGLVKSLEGLQQDAFERTVFEYFDFLAWSKSKVSGKRYREVLAA